MKMINMYAVLVISYSFGVIPWKQQELDIIDRKTRKLLTIYRNRHPRASVEWLYLSRKMGGRGLILISGLHNRLLCGMEAKLHSRSTPLLLEAHKIIDVRKMPRQTEAVLKDLNLSDVHSVNKHIIHTAQQEQLFDRLKSKALQ